MWAQRQGQGLAPSDEDILTFHDFLPKHLRNTWQYNALSTRIWIFLKPHTLLCESVNLPSTQNQWIRTPKLHIFDTTLQNGFFWDPTGLVNSCGRLKQGGGGEGWIQTRYTTPNSSRRRKYQVFGFRISGFAFTWPQNVHMNRNLWRCSIVTITELTQQRRRRRQRERQKSNKLRLAFLYISLPSLLDYDVKLPNFTFYEGCEHKTTIFFLFLQCRSMGRGRGGLVPPH